MIESGGPIFNFDIPSFAEGILETFLMVKVELCKLYSEFEFSAIFFLKTLSSTFTGIWILFGPCPYFPFIMHDRATFLLNYLSFVLEMKIFLSQAVGGLPHLIASLMSPFFFLC